MRVAFVCSNDTHVKMFAPVADELRRRPHVAVGWLSLDPLYHQGVGGAAQQAGLDVVAPSVEASPSGFYSRPVIAIWRDVLRARAPVRVALRRLNADTLVVGNDWGLVEKLVLSLSRELAIRDLVLVQDGRLTADPPSVDTVSRRLLRVTKFGLSPALRAVGLPYLASSRYGEGGTDLICASGPRSAALLSQRVANAALPGRVIVTGQPRYDRLRPLLRDRSLDPLRAIGIFTTPFDAAGLGLAPQRAQESLVRELASRVRAEGIRLFVKPHPREDVASYLAAVGRDVVTDQSAAELLNTIDLAIIGISTVSEEAALLRCPAIVPGRIVHGMGFNAMLPAAGRYPRFETLDELMALITELRDQDVRRDLARVQSAAIQEEVAFSPDRSAAARVSDAVLGLGGARVSPAG